MNLDVSADQVLITQQHRSAAEGKSNQLFILYEIEFVLRLVS